MRILSCFLLTLATAASFAQPKDKAIDSMQHLLLTEQRDSVKARLYGFIGDAYKYRMAKIDSALFYYQKSLDLSRKLNSPRQVFPANKIANIYNFNMGNYSAALQLLQQNLEFEKQMHDTNGIFLIKREIMWIYGSIGDYQKELKLAKELDSFATSGYFKDPGDVAFYQRIVYNNLADIYLNLNQLDSALRYRLLYYEDARQRKDAENLFLGTSGLAELYAKKGQLDSAFYYNRLWFVYAAESGRLDAIPEAQMRIAQLFQKTAQSDSAFHYSYLALHAFKNVPDTAGLMQTALLLSHLYNSRKQYDSAYTYLSYYTLLKDSSLRDEKIKKVLALLFNETLHQTQVEQEQKEAQQKYAANVKMYSLLAGIGVLLLLAIILYRNNKQKQKAKTEIEKAYQELKSTQAQLIQSEKMASLGELTAGIAHEIQNPLNFVNNFSEVNAELLAEMKEKAERGDMEDLKSLIHEMEDNELKINHHGRRADAIVKNMLQHSRTSTGKKEPTDINALCNEYLRLSYHGFRAKDKSFNAAIEINFDKNIGKFNIVSQDIGRVLLNLYNNAFYAVYEQKKKLGAGYEPTVRVGTKKRIDGIEIHVQDNGMGISKSLADKIFQPFFTTKPTGQGTGLGLSLSYDIVKAHGGRLTISPNEGEGAAFIMYLPYE